MATIIVLGILAVVAALALGLVSETAANVISCLVEAAFLLVLVALTIGGLGAIVYAVYQLWINR